MYKLICIMGESGSGKSTLEKELVDSCIFKKIVSMTTRPMRMNEVDGEDYYFVSDMKFQKYILEDMMAEYTEYGTGATIGYNFKYGIDKEEFEKMKNSPCIVVVTPDGYKKISEYIGVENTIPVYIETDQEKRIEKTFERYCAEAEKYKAEILRRVEGDKETFKDVKAIDNLIVLKNDYTKDSFINNLKEIINMVFLINDRVKNGTDFNSILGGLE